MSGGYLNEQGLKKGEHQVLIFTFKGPIPATLCRHWNNTIEDYKKLVFGDSLMSVTIVGKATPKARAARGKKRARRKPRLSEVRLAGVAVKVVEGRKRRRGK